MPRFSFPGIFMFEGILYKLDWVNNGFDKEIFSLSFLIGTSLVVFIILLLIVSLLFMLLFILTFVFVFILLIVLSFILLFII